MINSQLSNLQKKKAKVVVWAITLFVISFIIVIIYAFLFLHFRHNDGNIFDLLENGLRFIALGIIFFLSRYIRLEKAIQKEEERIEQELEHKRLLTQMHGMYYI